MSDVTTKPAEIHLQVDGGALNRLVGFDLPVEDEGRIYGSSIAYGLAAALKDQLNRIDDEQWKRQVANWLFPRVIASEGSFAAQVRGILADVGDMLIEKNAAYGNSALDPVRVFSKASTEEQLLVRLDDKLSRLARGHEYAGDDTLKDLLGYIVLLLIARQS